MRMESPDDYARWIERAARRLEEAMQAGRGGNETH
jgi:hypothetical protein